LNPTAHTIHNADLLAYLRGNRWLVQNGYIPKAHAILCDPPYFLGEMTKRFGKENSAELVRDSFGRGSSPYSAMSKGFMGKTWDGFESVWHFQHWVTEWAGLLIDYVHPGALGLFFGGTRTYHRLAAGLEDAGWEITDCIMWVHGQGFPKSASIGKLLDKEAGAAREVVGKSARHVSGKPEQRTAGLNGSSTFAETIGMGGTITAPATPLAARWEGYGTALKPAFEPVVVARAPRGKRTYAALAREFGTGALAIDAARIGTDEDRSRSVGKNPNNVVLGRGLVGNGYVSTSSPAGRWPANFALVCTCESDDHATDCPVAVLGAQSGTLDSGGPSRRPSGHYDQTGKGWFTAIPRPTKLNGYPDTGTAARFFYQAKAAAWEREAGLHDRTRQIVNDGRNTPIDNPFQRGDTQRLNIHPTLKPIRLASYLARLILPPEGDEPRRLLVPFAGSGSEMIGALLAGWDVVTGIEREAEYVDLARARVGWWAQFATYDEARAAYEQERKAKPAPVVIDEKPYTLPMLIMEAVNA
jgi:DNA modification methylase